MDRKDLKIEALRQKISKLVTQYEDQEADYRVEITMLSEENSDLKNRVLELENNRDTVPQESEGLSEEDSE